MPVTMAPGADDPRSVHRDPFGFEVVALYGPLTR